MINWKLLLCSGMLFALHSCSENDIATVVQVQKKGGAGCAVVEDEDLTSTADPEPPTVFKAKCMTCHNYSKDGTGPALKGFMKKAPSEEWFKAFIRNQDALIEQGDSLAIAIQTMRPSKGMHRQNLSEEEFNVLIEYLK